MECSPGQQYHIFFFFLTFNEPSKWLVLRSVSTLTVSVCCTWGEKKEKLGNKFLLFLLLVSHECGQGCCSFKPLSPLSLWQLLLLLPFKSHVYQNVQVWNMMWCHINEKLCLVPSLGLAWVISGTGSVGQRMCESSEQGICCPLRELEQQDLATNGLSRSNCSSPNWGSL